MNKPVSPAAHGVIDYLFSGVQLAAPALLRLNNTAVKTYGIAGAGFLVVNALTDTPAGLRRVLSFKGHRKADFGFLAGLAALTAVPFIRNHKKALLFHLGFLSVAVAHYVLTDYRRGSQQ